MGIELVSVSSGGTGGNSFSHEASISASGRFVTFTSQASNLVAGDSNGEGDIFVHDRQTGTTERVSVASDGTQADDFSFQPSISADGRFVTFSSDASNLVPGDTDNSLDIFVHDRQTGTTERVSVASDGTPADEGSFTPSISADGRFVTFSTDASNLVPGDSNGITDIFVHDRQTGTTERVSVASDGTQANALSLDPSISADGRFVAFNSNASNLVAGDSNGSFDIFVHDRQTGTTERVSVASDGAQGNDLSSDQSISADGRFVAFGSEAINLVAGDSNGFPDIFVHDRQTGTIERVSIASDGAQASAASLNSSISADGRFVTFQSNASNLVAGDTNGLADIFVHDRQTGTTQRISVDGSGVQANGGSSDPAISADGELVVFQSIANNLVPGDANGNTDVFVWTRNDAPLAQNDTLSAVAEDSGTRTIAFATLLGNDDDPNDDTLTISDVSGAIGGSVSISGSNVLFTPAADFNGPASFTYTASDGRGGTDTATVSFTVNPVNDTPLAQDDSFTASEDVALTGRNVITNTVPNGADSDADASDTLVVAGVGAASGNVGSAVAGSSGGLFTIEADGSLIFDPNGEFERLAAGQSAVTSIAYTISDGPGTDSATVTVTVAGVNDRPVATDDSFTASEDGPPIGGNVITNTVPDGADSDVDASDTLAVVGVGVASGNVGTAVVGSNGGLFTIGTDGSLSFDPNGDFERLFAGQQATTSVGYTISDGHGGSDTATVTVTVTGANEPDIFTPDDDTRDLNAFDLAAYTLAQATRALGGKDVVQLSQTQNLSVTFEAGAGNDTVTGSSSVDRIHGDGGKDRLLGEAGNDSLWGDAGDDSLSGGSGNDLLHAGDGFDFLTGGAGNDSFVFAESGTAASPEEDAVTDFGFGVGATGKDVIDLRAFDLADWTGSDSQVTVAGSGGSRTIHVDLNDDNNAANNTSQAEVVIFVNAGTGGFVRDFVISGSNPLADILV